MFHQKSYDRDNCFKDKLHHDNSKTSSKTSKQTYHIGADVRRPHISALISRTQVICQNKKKNNIRTYIKVYI